MDADAYAHSHETAIHCHPEVVRARIEKASLTAGTRFLEHPEEFGKVDVEPPYRLVARYRKNGDVDAHEVVREHPTSISGLMNMR